MPDGRERVKVCFSCINTCRPSHPLKGHLTSQSAFAQKTTCSNERRLTVDEIKRGLSNLVEALIGH